MRRIIRPIGALALALTLACASAQTTEYKTVAAATAGVETARSIYQDLRAQCAANPATTTYCTSIIASHDKLAASYVTYQKSVQLLADANIAALSTAAAPDAGAKVAAATSGLLAAANDFVALEKSITGGK